MLTTTPEIDARYTRGQAIADTMKLTRQQVTYGEYWLVPSCVAVKRKFGGEVRSKTDTAMKNEVLAKLVAHNLCCLIQEQHELGIDPIFWGASAKPQVLAAQRSVTELDTVLRN